MFNLLRLTHMFPLTAPGTYRARELSMAVAIDLVRRAHDERRLKSNISYPATADVLDALTGVEIRVDHSKDRWRLQTGDVALVCRPAVEVPRGRSLAAADLQFLLVDLVEGADASR